MVDAVNGIHVNDYFQNQNANIDSKYDFNKDGTVDIADYRLAELKLGSGDEEEAAEIGDFTLEDLNAVFADMIESDNTKQNYQEITAENANEIAETIINEVKDGMVNPENATSLNNLQEIGAKLTKYIKESAALIEVLSAQIPVLKDELDALTAEKEQKVAEFEKKQTEVTKKQDELNDKLKEAIGKQQTVSEQLEADSKATVDKVIAAYQNGEYPEGTKIQDVILSELGKMGVNTASIQSLFDEADSLGSEITALCTDIETLTVDISDVSRRYNAKYEAHSSAVSNVEKLKETSATASTQYQAGYEVRQQMRQELVDKYKVDATAGVDAYTMDNAQLGKLEEFLAAGELDNMPYADAYYVLKNAFDGCGITFDDANNTITVPYGHDDGSVKVYNDLIAAIEKNYTGVDAGELSETGYEDSECPSTTGPSSTSRSDPIGFTDGNVRYEFVSDNNNNGKFDDKSEFLGAKDGWAEMEAYDADGNGKIEGKELEKLQMVGIDQKTGEHDFISAAEAGIESIDLSTYDEVNEEQITGDLLVGNFQVNMKDGDVLDAEHTLDTDRNIQNKYGMLFGADMNAVAEEFEKVAYNPFMDQIVKPTINTREIADEIDRNIQNAQNQTDDISAVGASNVNKVANNADGVKGPKTSAAPTAPAEETVNLKKKI